MAACSRVSSAGQSSPGAPSRHQPARSAPANSDHRHPLAPSFGECPPGRWSYGRHHPEQSERHRFPSSASLGSAAGRDSIFSSEQYFFTLFRFSSPLKAMSFSALRSALALPLVAAAGVTAVLASPAQALTPAELHPILRGVSDRVGLSFADDVEYTFGYFFDIDKNNAFANALGFSFQDNWFTSGNPYQVTLWSYILDPLNGFTGTYTQLATQTFTPGDPNLVLADGNIPPTGAGNYYWLPLANPLPLPNTGLAVDPDGLSGYIVGATGIFGGANGNKAEVLGTPSFNSSLVAYEFEGYSFTGEEDYPVPIFPFSANGGIYENQGFWNANVSVDVPGPLPLLGVGAAFGWSRRLKRKTAARK